MIGLCWCVMASQVIARADKSGTTELFTSALSAFSPAWAMTYGAFSQGLNSETGEPERWNPDVVSYYGKTNQGVSGLILSIKYALGYLAVADAKEFNIGKLIFTVSISASKTSRTTFFNVGII